MEALLTRLSEDTDEADPFRSEEEEEEGTFSPEGFDDDEEDEEVEGLWSEGKGR